MFHPLIKIILTIAIASTVATAANAQRTVRKPDQYEIGWPASPEHLTTRKVEIITLNDPHTQKPCKVRTVTAEAITCSTHFGRKPIVYPRSTVAMLLTPHEHHVRSAINTILLIAGISTAAALTYPIGPIVFYCGVFGIVILAHLA